MRSARRQTCTCRADVLARAERAAHSGERQPHALEREREARGNLSSVDVEPLRRDVELDTAAIVIGNRETGLGPEEGLVLHPDLVRPLDDHRAGCVGITVSDAHVTEQIAVGVDRGRVECGDRIRERDQRLVLDADRVHGAACGVGVVGRDRGDRLAGVADDFTREHRLVRMFQSVLEPTRHVVRRHDRVHAGDAIRRRQVDRPDARGRMRRTQRRAPQHPFGPEVRTEREAAAYLRDAVGTGRALADARAAPARVRPGLRRGGRRRRHGASLPRCCTVSRTACRMRP